MQTPNEPLNDLEYLSRLGFEQIPVSESEIGKLKKRIRSRFYPSANSVFIISMSLLTGALLGGFCFYFLSNQVVDQSTTAEAKEIRQIPDSQTENGVKEIHLDTLVILRENFQKPVQLHLENKKERQTVLSEGITDSLQVIILDPAIIPEIPVNSFTEQKLKFIINSPIVYIHDLKVSEYTSLYFKKNKFVKFANWKNTSADRASGEEVPGNVLSLKQEAKYYLHEELSEALLLFKQQKYDWAIAAFKKVAEYNKEDVNSDFYLGMCFYYKKNYLASITYFNSVIENPNNAFLQEANYYKALTFLEQGNKKEAEILLKRIMEEGGFYSGKAGSILFSTSEVKK